jgi:hypothetical protein
MCPQSRNRFEFATFFAPPFDRQASCRAILARVNMLDQSTGADLARHRPSCGHTGRHRDDLLLPSLPEASFRIVFRQKKYTRRVVVGRACELSDASPCRGRQFVGLPTKVWLFEGTQERSVVTRSQERRIRRDQLRPHIVRIAVSPDTIRWSKQITDCRLTRRIWHPARPVAGALC